MALKKSHILLSAVFALTASLCPSTAWCAGDGNTHTPLMLNHLDLGLTAGSTGLGLNLQVPVCERVHVRAGIEYMPRIVVPMTFNLMSYTDGAGVESEEVQKSKFEKMSEFLEGFTGIKVDRKVDMHAKGTMLDFRFMVDVFPFRGNRHWYATAGFYWGASKVGHIQNTIEEAPSLMGVLIYNRFYDFFVNETYLDQPLWGSNYWNPDDGDVMKEKFERYGRVGAHVGDYVTDGKAGQPYLMEPGVDGMVKADMYVNSFKPYLGIGYTTTLKNYPRWSLGFDGGALFWGKPSVITHEGVDLATDVEKVKGKVGDYLDVAKVMHVWPTINFRISYRLF